MCHHLRLAVSLLLLSILVSACRHGLGRTAATPRLPCLGVVYLPFAEPNQTSSGWQPIPNDADWTTERMIRDLRRLHDSGIRLLAVHLELFDLIGNPVRRDAWRTFAKEAANAQMTLVPLLVPTPGRTWNRDEQENFRRVLLELAREPATPMAKIDGQILCLLANHTPTWRAMDPQLAIFKLQPSATHNDFQEIPELGWLLAHAPLPPPTNSTPRQRRQALVATLDLAARQTPKCLILIAWNDFAEGYFLEPNTLDGNSLLETLRHWTARQVEP